MVRHSIAMRDFCLTSPVDCVISPKYTSVMADVPDVTRTSYDVFQDARVVM
jgi:hypothetical protein